MRALVSSSRSALFSDRTSRRAASAARLPDLLGAPDARPLKQGEILRLGQRAAVATRVARIAGSVLPAASSAVAAPSQETKDHGIKPHKPEDRLTIGIVGFGLFGKFIAARLVKAGHRVLATSRTPYDKEAAEIGVEFYHDGNDFCEEHPEVVILATSILSVEPTLKSLPLMRLKRNTLVVDVLSVKVFPKQLLLQLLPPELDILCTHPMFGPQSGPGSWEGLNFQYEKVRVGEQPVRQQRVEKFLKFWSNEGCRMVQMTCEEHDQVAASTQFVTHTVGRMLGTLRLNETPIDTKGFKSLINLVNNTNADSFELYYGLFLYNQNATDELERLEKALESVKERLFSQLHDVARKEMFPTAMLEKMLSKTANRILHIFFRGIARLSGFRLGAPSGSMTSMTEDWETPSLHREHPEEMVMLYQEMIKVWRNKAFTAANVPRPDVPLFSSAAESLAIEDGVVILPSKVTPAVSALREAYTFVDLNGDGKVSPGELAARMLKLTSTRSTPEEMQMMMKLCDVDGDGTLQLKELIFYVAYDFFSSAGGKQGVICPQSLRASLYYLGVNQDVTGQIDDELDNTIKIMLDYANMTGGEEPPESFRMFSLLFTDIRQLAQQS